MKVVILAGGKGSRIFEFTKKLPKPMIKISWKNNFRTHYFYLLKAII